MKKQLFIAIVLNYVLYAQNITLTPKQEANWQIKTEIPQSTQIMPLGEFVAEVVTPPSLLHTISLPFEATVTKLNVSKYQKVLKGDVLAEVSGTEWISVQKQAISDAIEFRHHRHLSERKNLLCKEEIIPQKECTAANAELKTDTMKVASSKALLASYGASEEMISTLFQNLKLSDTMKVTSQVSGRITELHATPGKSSSPADALFVIQEAGSLWLECAIEATRVNMLKEKQTVQITLNNETFETTILQLSPVINAENQTRQVRLGIPKEINTYPGLRTNIKIALLDKTLKIAKNAIIKDEDRQIVFLKTKEGYTTVAVEILAEDDKYYFVKPSTQLENMIAVTSLSVLKNMLGSEDE